MNRILLVALGGALGSVARYGVGVGAARALGITFPWGTLAVNLLGSFLIAVVVELALAGSVSPTARLFLTTGILGGFTTYSAFNQETVALLGERLWGVALLNLGATVLGCLAAGLLGQQLGRMLARG